MRSNCLYIMDVKRVLFPCLFLLGIWQRSSAQAAGKDSVATNRVDHEDRYKAVYDTTGSDQFILYTMKKSSCKSFFWEPLLSLDRKKLEAAPVKEIIHATPGVPPVPFLQLHGNIAYTFDYRSQLDTPFAASNLQQHNEQVFADATLKGRYPFRIVVNSRQSNSPFFKNYTDLNVEFNHEAFQRNIKEGMISDMTKKMNIADSAGKYERWIKNQKTEYATLTNWVADPTRTQEIVQEKERIYQQVLLLTEKETKLYALKDSGNSTGVNWTMSGDHGLPVSTDSLLAQIAKRKDSLLARMQQPTETEKKMRDKGRLADSLYKFLQSRQHEADSLRALDASRIKDYADKIRNARSIGELEDLEKKAGTNSLSKQDKTLLSVTHFGIGRSSVNYSDLTVNNISLNGLNVEYNPSWYGAFAVGSVDYLFRDFIVQPGAMPKQNLVLGRFGWGDKEKQIFVLTAYTGTKNSFGGNTTAILPPNPAVNSMQLFGYSFETRYRLNQNTEFSFEAAKSSSPYTTGTDKSKSFDHAFVFSDHNNEALSAKFNLTLPSTRSVFNLFYKNIGANFQSYSVFNSGTRQEGWGIKWRQYLFRDQLSITLQIKKSNFDDPLIATGYNSSLVFKSAQLVYRKKKWPLFTAGYMPSTQLIKSSTGYLSENIYYALTAGIFYNYTMLKLRMNSSLMFSRFYNQGTDTGFIHYNARNILYTHTIDLGKIHTLTEIQYTQQPGLLYWSFQQGLDITIGKFLTVGGSLKDDLLPETGTSYWGGSLQTGIRFKNIGGLRMQYNKDYLPNGSNSIVPNNWGRVMWFKVF